jgi:uncharacterized protein
MPEEPEETPDSVFWTAIAVELGLGVIALALGWMTEVDVRQWIPRPEPGQLGQIFSGLGWGLLAAVPMLVAMELLERVDWEPIRKLKMLEDMPAISSLLSLNRQELIAISIAAGIGEELLLRGWLMAWLLGPVNEATPFTIAIALVGSSIAFGAMHPITWTYSVIAAIMGLYFGALVFWSGNLLVPIMAHAAYDAVHLLMAKHQHDAKASSSSGSDDA